ncbi:lysophospholipid acyltransferase family protein [Cetobacterium sp. SF1]|uniref:lysophospholipid acyltransferase family protein n=1 Tax=unclassified Cetobacterium TaxID=2630983 RepID=UPI003CE8534A
MLGLVLAIITALFMFAYISIFYLPKIKKMPERQGVKAARKQLRKLSTVLLKVLGVKVNVTYINKLAIINLKNEDGIVLVANHESNFDIPVIIKGFPMDIGFVAKKEMETWPFYSTWMKASKCVFLDRSNPREGIKSIKRAVETIKAGYPTVIFPEGERTLDGNMGEFKKGSFKLATETKGVIVPISLVGTRSIQKRGSVLINRNKKINLTIGEPIYIKDLDEESLKNLNKIVKNIVQSNKKL